MDVSLVVVMMSSWFYYARICLRFSGGAMGFEWPRETLATAPTLYFCLGPHGEAFQVGREMVGWAMRKVGDRLMVQ